MKNSLFIKFLLVFVLLVGIVIPVSFTRVDATEDIGGNTYTARVQYVKDGDSIKVTQPFFADVNEIRTLNMDAPETFSVDNLDPGNQIDPHGIAARDYLRKLLPRNTQIIVVTEEQELDGFGRLLAHVYRASDGLYINLEMVRAGFNEPYFIGNPPNHRFEAFRNATIEARNNQLGIWNPANPLQEHPFEYRLRMFGNDAKRFVADYSTGSYVDPEDYALIAVENRIFFNTEEEAIAAGYTRK